MIAYPTGPPWDDAYKALQILFHNQATEAAQNQAVHDKYVSDKSNWNLQTPTNIALGLAPAPAPVMPLQTIYNDDGSVSNPPFPDLTPCVLPTMTTGATHGMFPGAVPLQGGMTSGEQNIMAICQEILSRLPAKP